MKILLDIDDTSWITKDKGKTWNEHPRMNELLRIHSVYLYSGNPKIDEFAKRWNVKGYYPKGDDLFPIGDVLIDNDAELWVDFVEVQKYYHSIDDFLDRAD